MKEILAGHVSPETAYVVADYPYGFRLRCQIRYWLEFKKGKGYRLVSQTSNPKKPGLVWNKPKASTYAMVAAAMFLNDEGHVTWATLTEYNSTAECKAWRETFGAALPEDGKLFLDFWIAKKEELDAKLASGEIKIVTTVTRIDGSVLMG